MKMASKILEKVANNGQYFGDIGMPILARYCHAIIGAVLACQYWRDIDMSILSVIRYIGQYCLPVLARYCFPILVAWTLQNDKTF